MASSLIANALQVNFDSVLGIPDNDGMVKMFRALESTGLRGFLGCPSVLYEKELEQFFDTAFVKDNEILCRIHGKFVAITEDRFACVFELPTEGLTDLSEVPRNLVFDARSLFSKSGEPHLRTLSTRLLSMMRDGAENEISRNMASVTASKQFLKEPLRSGEDDDMSGVEQLGKIIDTEEDTVKNKETDIKLVEIETEKEIDPEPVENVGQIVEKLDDSEDTGHLSKALTLTKKSSPSDEDSMYIDDILKRIPEDMMLPLRRLAVLKSVKDIAAKEEKLLTWPETDSVQVALQRRLYIVAKYRELLLQKFLEAHRDNFRSGQPWSTMALHIIEMLSNAHQISLAKTLIKFDGVWTPIEGPDWWYCMCNPSCFHKKQLLPQREYVSDLDPICVFIEPVQGLEFPPPMVKTWGWFRVCTNILQFNLLGHLQPVGTINLCTAIGPKGLDVDRTVADSEWHWSSQELPLIKDDHLEKALAEAHTQQDQAIRGLIKIVRQEVQTQKAALSIEMIEFKKAVRAQNAILTTDLADIRKEVQDQKAALSNDIMEFRVQAQENFNTLTTQLLNLLITLTEVVMPKRGKVVTTLLLKIEVNLDLEMVVVVVAEVNLQEEEEAVVLDK
ncbi:splicing factor 3B subunit 1-like [Dorcoceras hygrometricum]|uniref:Splicing factor 3B subunit 1-like n=1 Tax=Dorcoceras hygrometricum TaxID=472368 RepID=A0A2Z7AUJ6_9LAMI|nr:splicing factor 3B subunit 1-like [Dorcoceras hygrometricum]